MQRSRGHFAPFLALAVLGSALTACGSTSGGDAGGGDGSGSANNNGSGSVGPTGGSVSLPSGPSVSIPAGALPANTTITVAASMAAAPPTALTSIYEFGPDGTDFAGPVTVSFNVKAGTKSTDVSLYWTKKGNRTEWETIPVTVSGTVATAQVIHFSAGYVGAACTAGTACVPGNACHLGVTTCGGGSPACSDTGSTLADGAACGGSHVCTAGVCGPPPAACTPNQSCTPTGTADPCKTYATSCGAGGVATCGASGNAADGTACGSGLTCSAGVCGTSNTSAYFSTNGARSYTITQPGGSTLTEGMEAVSFAAPLFVYQITSSTSGQASAKLLQTLTFAGGVAATVGTSGVDATGAAHPVVTYSPPQVFFPADLSPGAKSSSTSTVTNGSTTYTETREITVNGLESVTVPAGTFQAMKISFLVTPSNKPATAGSTWFAPGVGSVKGVNYTVSNPGALTTLVLNAYSPMDCTGGTCVCNTVAYGAAAVPVVNVASTLPTAAGGTLADGVYDLTGRYAYTGAGGASGSTTDTQRTTLVVAGGVQQRITSSNGAADQHTTVLYTVNGTNLATVQTCGGTGTVSSNGFTATPDQIRLVFTNPPGTTPLGYESVFTRRGAATCTPGQACTPTGTPDPCKTYATTCGAGGVSTCGVSGNVADDTSCGTNLTCRGGSCQPTGTGPITVTGKVVDLWNLPQSGKRVQILGMAGAQVTDAAGAFTFPGVTPPYRIVLDDHAATWDDWEVWDGMTRPDPVLSTGHYTQATQRSAPVTVTVSGGTPGASTLAFLTAPRARHSDVLYAVPSFTAPSGAVTLNWMGDATLTADLHLVQFDQGVVTAYAKVAGLTLHADQSSQVGAPLEAVISDLLASIVTGPAGISLGSALVLDGDEVTGTQRLGSSPLSLSMPRIPGAQLTTRFSYPGGEGCVLLSPSSTGPIALDAATGATVVSPTSGSIFDAATDPISWSPISPIQPPGALYFMSVTWPQNGRRVSVSVNTRSTSFNLSSLATLAYPVPSIPSGTGAFVLAGAETGLTADDFASPPGLWCPRNTRYGQSVGVTAK